MKRSTRTRSKTSNRGALIFAAICTATLGLTLAQAAPPRAQTDQAPTNDQSKLVNSKPIQSKMGKPKAFQHKKQPKTSIIYPKSTGAITFSHQKHAKTACVTCHTQATQSTKTAQSLMPTMQVCASCHTSDKSSAKPKLNQCAGCHQNYSITTTKTITTPKDWRTVRPAPMTPTRPKAHLKFNHKKHLKHSTNAAQTQRLCVQCHNTTTTHTSMPNGQSCASCHNGQIIKNQCSTCHLQQKNGRLQTQFTSTTPTKTKTTQTTLKLKPDNHTVDWIKRHGAISRMDGNSCMSCHAQTTCTSCHQQKNAIPRTVHPPNFLILHRVAAKAQQANCTTCHQQQTFCTSCHIRSKNVPRAGFKPPLAKKKYHPPGWLSKANARNHGVLAKQNINNCASCHQERDCLSCHKGISPHPQNFATQCKRQFKSNPQPCLKCHQNTRMLSMQCR